MEDSLAEGRYKQIILQHGPFTLEEYDLWDQEERADYLQLMTVNLTRIGLERFVAAREGLRRTVEMYVLQEPELTFGAARQRSAK